MKQQLPPSIYSRMVELAQSMSAPRQRMLISLLFLCERYRLSLPIVLKKFAGHLPRTPLENRRRTGKFYWAQIDSLAEDLDSGKTLEEVLAERQRILSDVVVNIRETSRAVGGEALLQDAWLQRSPDRLFDERVPSSRSGLLFLLFAQVVVVSFVWTRMNLYVFPNLREMAEEFQMDVYQSFEGAFGFAAQWVKDGSIYLSMIPAMFLIVFLVLVFRRWRVFLRRWNAFTWMQPVSSSLYRRRIDFVLALVSKSHDAAEDDHVTASVANRKGMIQQAYSNGVIGKNEVAALDATGNHSVQVWLMSRFAEDKRGHSEKRYRRWVSFLTALMYVFIGVVLVIGVVFIFVFLTEVIGANLPRRQGE